MSNFNLPEFPVSRLRRLRKTAPLRDMFRETFLTKNDFIYPLFVAEGENFRRAIGSMPDVFQLSIDNILRECEELLSLGIYAVLLFGIPDFKDEIGSSGYASDGIVQKASREIKKTFPEMLVVTDVCLCEYTSHGHCGVIENEYVQNDATLELLAKQALTHAQNGADIIAPSDMMDGRVGAIRKILDENGFHETPIMAYSAKFASAFYGPFREAAESAPQFGDRKSYQMDAGNAIEAMREIALDIQEGADVVMILRIQRERQDSAYFPTLREYSIHYGLTNERLNLAKPDAIVLHPGPMNRGIEISSDVADSSRSLILDQVKYGVAVRMAVLYLATGGTASPE